jgi:hypothetical protein
MRRLLDECVPRPLKPEIVGHDVHHVADMGWSSTRNGELLRLMVAERFETLLTVNIRRALAIEADGGLRAAVAGCEDRVAIYSNRR